MEKHRVRTRVLRFLADIAVKLYETYLRSLELEARISLIILVYIWKPKYYFCLKQVTIFEVLGFEIIYRAHSVKV